MTWVGPLNSQPGGQLYIRGLKTERCLSNSGARVRSVRFPSELEGPGGPAAAHWTCGRRTRLWGPGLRHVTGAARNGRKGLGHSLAQTVF